MITKAFIHEYGNGKIESEYVIVKNILESKGIVCKLFTSKTLQRNQLNIDRNTLIVGNHPIIETVFKRIKYDYINNSYPKSLQKYLKRNVWESSLESLFQESLQSNIHSIFIKPKVKTKLFTGFVINSNSDLFSLEKLSKKTKIYCSEKVNWLSEFRVFVINSKIVGIKNYAGNPEININLKEVETVIQNFENSTEKTAAYGIDFGVLDNGETAFIEWNDGFALGSYNLDDELYTNLLIARWNEILEICFNDYY
ncbi:ATP-grasp domain-containing protein [Aureivirga marina]|uniref:ATP-grasp domain-containing protein n=1 Tax=Aureivirga marina TaxID=1182451 RepID=UPI0018CAC40D|nr:ATP-grasp domain-containing protein [Aureivirga marina]